MKYVVFALALIYALVSLYASLPVWKKADRRLTAILMTAGAVLLIATAILSLTGWSADWLLCIIGSLLLVEAAVLNGARVGRTHPKHHAVRFIITLALVIGFAIW